MNFRFAPVLGVVCTLCASFMFIWPTERRDLSIYLQKKQTQHILVPTAKHAISKMSTVADVSIFSFSSLAVLKWLCIEQADFGQLNVQALWDFILTHTSCGLCLVQELFSSETRLLQLRVPGSIVQMTTCFKESFP